MSGSPRVPARRKGLTTGGAIAIDIRRDVVYLVHVEGRPEKPARARFRREPIDPSLYSENPLEAAASAIGRMTQGLDLRKIPATVVLPNNREAVRVKRFPSMKKRALASAADIAMRADAFSSAAETTRRYFVQRHGEAGDGSRFEETVLIEADAAAIADAESLARLAGLRLVRVTSPALALASATAALCPPSQTCLVVDLFGPGTTMNVYSGGRFLLSRECDVAADLLSGDIEAFLAHADAPDVARGRGEAASVQTRSSASVAIGEPTDAAALPVSPRKLATEIDRTNRYLVAQFRHTIDTIYFAGPSLFSRALAERIREPLGIPIELFAPESIVSADALEGEPTCSSARCLGAALELLAPARTRRYNLIARSSSTRHLSAPAVAAASIVALVGVSLGVVQWRLGRAGTEIASLRAREARAQAALAPMALSGGPSSDELRARVEAIRALRRTAPRWSRPLDALGVALPEGVWLTGIAPEASEETDAPALSELLGGEAAGVAAGAPEGGAAGNRSIDSAEPPPRLLLLGRSRTLEAIFEMIPRLERTGLLADPRVLSLDSPDVATGSASSALPGADDGAPSGAWPPGSADRTYSFLIRVGAIVSPPGATQESD